MAWPHLAASLTLSASVTAWTHDVAAPIAGRAPDEPPAPGSRVGPDGTIMEIVNDRLDQTPMRNAEAALEAAQARVAAANERLEVLRLAEEKRRDVMLRTSPVERTRDAESEIGRAGAELGAARASEREGLQVLMTEREAYRVKSEGDGEGAARRDPLQHRRRRRAWWRRAIRSRDGSIATSCWSMRRSSTRGCGCSAVGGRGQVMLEGEDHLARWRDHRPAPLGRRRRCPRTRYRRQRPRPRRRPGPAQARRHVRRLRPLPGRPRRLRPPARPRPARPARSSIAGPSTPWRSCSSDRERPLAHEAERADARGPEEHEKRCHRVARSQR